MKQWKIAVSWEVCGEVEIEAETIEDAIKKVEDDDDLPPNPRYVDGSFYVDEQMSKWLNRIEDE